jgi:hypothetical protein
MSLATHYGLPAVLPHRSEARLAPLRAMRHRVLNRKIEKLKYSNTVTEQWRFGEEKKWRE